jgi:hypothetical protein
MQRCVEKSTRGNEQGLEQVPFGGVKRFISAQTQESQILRHA